MKVSLTHKEANLLNAIIWELTEERGVVHGDGIWRLSDEGADLCKGIADKLEEANDKAVRKSGKDRDLSGSPKGTILTSRWQR